jgi:hypothetical protein
METPRSTIPAMPSAPESAQEKPGFRTKTIATRITQRSFGRSKPLPKGAVKRSRCGCASWL